jgi:hypothetical protein
MSLSSFLDKVAGKPDHIKKRYSFFFAFAVTAIIFSFWINSFGYINDKEDQVLADVVDKVDSPAKSLVANVGTFASDIKDIIFGPKKINYSTVEVKPGRK